MSSEILWCAVFLLLFVGCAIIIWFFLDYVKKRRRPDKNEIFICADCWLEVFHFLAPSQLGLEIALISRRFDLRVDEHFKTRKWKLNKQFIIQWDIDGNGTKKMQIVNSAGEPLPIPRIPLSNKVIGSSKCIQIIYIDQNVVAFLRHFRPVLANCATEFDIITENVRIPEFVVLNIWPMFRHSMHVMYFNSIAFRRMRQLAPALLTDCPPLRDLSFDDGILPEFPADDSAMASDGQAVAKWLFAPHPENLPKFLCYDVNLSMMDQLVSTMEQIKAAFSNASSPVTFGIIFVLSSPLDSVVPFDRINEVTGEKLTLQQSADAIRLKRCPIGWDQRKWENVIHEVFARQNRNPIDILIRDGGFDDGLLGGASPGPSDQQQQQKCHRLDNIV